MVRKANPSALTAVATPLGVRAERLGAIRQLRAAKGRRMQQRFAFEGATLLEEAHFSAVPIQELYVTQAAYDATALVRRLEGDGVPTFIVEPASAASISDLQTAPGILAVAPIRLHGIDELLGHGQLFLVLADVNDPANAGTLLRSADAFGCAGVVFGELGVDPYHPKVVRGSMGAIFRLPIAVAAPEAVAGAAGAAAVGLVGLTAVGADLKGERWNRPVAVVVGNERRGLNSWEPLCERVVGIPMAGRSESLSAAVAGSIALYEASCPTATDSELSRE